MSQEGVGLKASVKYAKLEKWPNKPDGTPDKSNGPDEVMEKFGEDEPFKTTYRRNANAAD